MKDYYKLLQVHPEADPEVIEAAYRRLAAKFDPEAFPDDPAIAASRQDIDEAFAILGNPDERAAYDASLVPAVMAVAPETAPLLSQAQATYAAPPPRRSSYGWVAAVAVAVIAIVALVFVLRNRNGGANQATETPTVVAQASIPEGAPSPAPAAAITATPLPFPTTDTSGPYIMPPSIPNFTVADRPQRSQGDAEAPVVMYEWSDYTCPHCLRFHNDVLPILQEKYIKTGKMRLVYKEYPVVSGDLSVIGSLAAQCAANQNRYEAMADWLFTNDEWKGQDAVAKVTEAAVALGLDTAAFETCFSTQASLDPVIEDYQEGQNIGITGTPNFVINGHWVQGALSPDEFGLIIDALLTEAESGKLPADVVTVTPSPTPDTDFNAEEDHFLGSADAPITVVEFSDYQCPFCLRHDQETLPKLKEQYIDTGKVKYVFMDFPLDSIHPQARAAAGAAECAGAQGKYWEMHDKLFSDQAAWNGNAGAIDVFKSYAPNLGLDAEAFASCLDSNQFGAEIAADQQDGADAGVTGTPAFFINGRFVSGAQPIEVFQQMLDQMLAEQ